MTVFFQSIDKTLIRTSPRTKPFESSLETQLLKDDSPLLWDFETCQQLTNKCNGCHVDRYAFAGLAFGLFKYLKFEINFSG